MQPGYQYYVCRGRSDAQRVAHGDACSPYVPGARAMPAMTKMAALRLGQLLAIAVGHDADPSSAALDGLQLATDLGRGAPMVVRLLGLAVVRELVPPAVERVAAGHCPARLGRIAGKHTVESPASKDAPAVIKGGVVLEQAVFGGGERRPAAALRSLSKNPRHSEKESGAKALAGFEAELQRLMPRLVHQSERTA